MNNPYHVIKNLYVTEKTTMLEKLHVANSNKSLARCDTPKYTFVVDKGANKADVKAAVEAIYADRNVKVIAVNTINTKPKQKRKGRGRPGFSPAFKKAIVTLRAGDSLE